MTDTKKQVDIPAKEAVALTSSIIQLDALNRETERMTKQRDTAQEQLTEMVTTLAARVCPEGMVYVGLDLQEAVMVFEKAPENQEGDSSTDSPE